MAEYAGGPMSAGQLARATQAHEPSLYRVLRLLASLGVLAEQDDRSFGLTVLGERLRTGEPASVRSWAMLVDALGGVGAFEPIIETVRTGKPGFNIAIPHCAMRGTEWADEGRCDPN